MFTWQAYTTTLQDRIVLYPHMMAKNPQRGSGRIVGGTEATPNSYPHLVFLLIDSLYVCGGNIFNENTIITAAHCADGANRIQITAGAHDQTANEPSQQVVISTSHIEHPDWNSFTLSGDVAILYLDSPLEVRLNFLSTGSVKRIEHRKWKRGQHNPVWAKQYGAAL